MVPADSSLREEDPNSLEGRAGQDEGEGRSGSDDQRAPGWERQAAASMGDGETSRKERCRQLLPGLCSFAPL